MRAAHSDKRIRMQITIDQIAIVLGPRWRDYEDTARALFSDKLLERVTGLYGVRPTVEFVQIATLVENA
jgi:hypothetical protein